MLVSWIFQASRLSSSSTRQFCSSTILFSKPRPAITPKPLPEKKVLKLSQRREARLAKEKEARSKLKELSPEVRSFLLAKPVNRRLKPSKSYQKLLPFIIPESDPLYSTLKQGAEKYKTPLKKPAISDERVKNLLDQLPFDYDENETNKEYVASGFAASTRLGMIYWQIIPQFARDFTPSISLKVLHSEKHAVWRGMYMSAEQVREKPSISFQALNSKDFYTLVMFDPDIPLKKAPNESWIHYLVTDIPGNEISKGKVIADFFPSAPPKGSGVHRYIWFVMKQNGGQGSVDVSSFFSKQPLNNQELSGRVIDIKKFFSKNQLRPKGACFYRTSYDPSIDSLGLDMPSFDQEDYRMKANIKSTSQFQYM